jgi:arginase
VLCFFKYNKKLATFAQTPSPLWGINQKSMNPNCMHSKSGKPLSITACPSDLAAGKKGSSDGVAILIEKCITPLLPEVPIFIAPTANNVAQGRSFAQAKGIEQVALNMAQVYHLLLEQYQQNRFTLNITADHSNAIGTFSAFSDFYGAENAGLIWIDAHADMHSPLTTPSGNIHGMPLAALMGIDNAACARNSQEETGLLAWWDRLKDIGLSGLQPKLMPQNIVIIGLRDMEEEEETLLKNLAIRYVKPEEILSKGAAIVAAETLNYLAHCNAVYCSFDIDSLDESLVPATGTPVDNGISLQDATTLLSAFWQHPQLASFTVTEFNPNLENGNSTFEHVNQLLSSMLKI